MPKGNADSQANGASDPCGFVAILASQGETAKTLALVDGGRALLKTMQVPNATLAVAHSDDRDPAPLNADNDTSPSAAAIAVAGSALTAAAVAGIATNPQQAADAVASGANGLGLKREFEGTTRQVGATGRKLGAAVDGTSKHLADGTSAAASSPAVKSTEAVNASTPRDGQHQGDIGVPAPVFAQSGGQQPMQFTGAAAVPSPEANAAQAGPHSDGASVLPQAPQANAQPAGEISSPALSGAQLIQTMHQSEMRLGMNSAEFGNISISTSLTRQSLSAQISLDHSELGRALALHLPAMEDKLGSSFGLPTRIEVRDSSQQGSGGFNNASGDGRQQQSSNAGSGSKLSLSSAARVAISGGLIASSTPTPALAGARLDITV